MNQTLKLLEMKNYWLSKFLKTTELFLEKIKCAYDFDADKLDLFDKNRATILNIVRKTDLKIEESLVTPRLQNHVPSASEKTQINYYLREKDSILSLIIKLDTEIIALLESFKKRDEEKFKTLEKGKKALSKYKSQEIPLKQVDRQV